MKKIAIYTALYGDRDTIKAPVDFEQLDGVDYYLFTNHKTLTVAPYTTIYRDALYEDTALNARAFKILGDELLKDYDILIWHDANIQLCLAHLPELLSYSKDTFLTTFTHPHRDDVYSEAMSCARVGKAKPFVIAKQLFNYFVKGVPAHQGMWSTGILIKNNLHYQPDVLSLWWTELRTYSRRDQIALAYVVYKLELEIAIIDANIFDSKYANYYLHHYQDYTSMHGGTYSYSRFEKRLAYFFIKLLRKLKKL